MRFLVCFICAALLAMTTAAAQQAGSGWLGVEIKDLTKEEADALGWDEPRGAKVVKPVPGSPAELGGLQPDDILLSLDGTEIENIKSFTETLGKKAAGTEVRLSVRRAGREKRLSVALGARPAELAAGKPAEERPQLMLDTGGHMAIINAIAFTPDGKQLVSASDDKTIRIWDLATGKTQRIIHGESAPGDPGKVFALALSPDGKRLAAAGWMKAAGEAGQHIRLYDFASGRLVTLLKGHSNVVLSLAFSPDGRHLISGSADHSAIIWPVGPGLEAGAEARPEHRLAHHGGEIYGVGFTPTAGGQ